MDTEHSSLDDVTARILEILRNLDDPWSLAYGLATLGMAQSPADPAAGERLLREAVATARTQGRTVLLAFALYWQARLALAGDGRVPGDR